MKPRNTAGQKAARTQRRTAARAESLNLPRMFLFLELFVEKDMPDRSTK